MAFWRGNGGRALVGSPQKSLPISKWAAEESAALANVTNAKSAGHKQRKRTVRDSSFSLELPWDDGLDPHAIGLTPGAEIALVLEKGESGKKMTSSNVVIEKVGFTNDEDEDVVRLVVSGYSNVAFVHS